MSDDLVKKLRSQIGDDVQDYYLPEALFRAAADRIEALTVECDEARKEHEGWQSAAVKLMEQVTALIAERDRAEDELYELQQTCITLRGENEALPAVQPKVKPLVWEGAEGEDITAQPDRFHTYVVRKLSEKIFDVILSHELGSLWFRQSRNEVWPDYTTAKAAAQADYAARILAALKGETP